MKHLFLSCAFVLAGLLHSIGQVKPPPPDKSPMDISYYPINYPLLKIQDKVTSPLLARVIYSRPQKNGRTIFGDLIDYNKIWRLGANEATEIEFYQNVKINNTKIKKGRYTLYAIPDTVKWILVLNKETDTWGSFVYDELKDAVRVEVPVEKQNDIAEYFTLFFDKSPDGFELNICWEDVKVSLPISL